MVSTGAALVCLRAQALYHSISLVAPHVLFNFSFATIATRGEKKRHLAVWVCVLLLENLLHWIRITIFVLHGKYHINAMRFCLLAAHLWQCAHDILAVYRERYCSGKCGAAGCGSLDAEASRALLLLLLLCGRRWRWLPPRLLLLLLLLFVAFLFVVLLLMHYSQTAQLIYT